MSSVVRDKLNTMQTFWVKHIIFILTLQFRFFSFKILFLTASLSNQDLTDYLPNYTMYPHTKPYPLSPHHEEAPLLQDEQPAGRPHGQNNEQIDEVIRIDDQEIIEYYEDVADTELDVDKESSEVTEKAYMHSSGGFIWWFGFPAVPATYGHK